MKNQNRCQLYLQFLILLITANVSIDALAGDSFQKEFLSSIEVTKSIEMRPSFSNLTQDQKNQLLATRRVVAEFLRALESGADPLAFLTPELKQKYATREVLAKQEFNAEAYIRARVFDFQIDDKKQQITLRLFLTGATEGTHCTEQRQFSLVHSAGGWKISQL